MSNDVIRILIGELINNSGQIKQKAGELRELNIRFSAVLDRMEESWKGPASQNYIKGMRNYLAQAENAVNMLESFEGYANYAVESFSTGDKEAADVINQS